MTEKISMPARNKGLIITYKEISIRSIATIEARRQWNNSFNILRLNKCRLVVPTQTTFQE